MLVQGLKLKVINKSYSALLLFGFGVIILLMMGLIASHTVSMNKTRQHLNIVVDEHLSKVALSMKMGAAVHRRTLILFQFMYFDDPFERDEAWVNFRGAASDFMVSRNKILNMPLTKVERNLLNTLGVLTNINGPIQRRVVDLVNEGRNDEAGLLLNEEAVPALADVHSVMERFVAHQWSMAKGAQKEAITKIETMRGVILFLGIAAMLAGVVIAIIIVNIVRQRTQLDIYHSTHDMLTQLPNRLLLIDRLEQSVNYAKRNNTYIAVMFIDVDRFKFINDKYGHAIGDSALLSIRDKLKKQLRDIDTLARLSGDEFIIVLEDVAGEEAVTIIADRIVKEFQSLVSIESYSIKIGVSIGISLFPKHGNTPDLLINHADKAMYESKKNGRNSWSMYSLS